MSTTELSPVQIKSHSTPDSTDFEKLETQLARERAWYKDVSKFETQADIDRAFEDRELRLVEDTEGYRLIERFNKDKIWNKPYLTPVAFASLQDWNECTFKWLDQESEDHEGVRYAITSLSRSIELQRKLRAEGKLAVMDSTHTAGSAWDVDMSGYYQIINGKEVAISVPERKPGHDKLIESLVSRGIPSDELPTYRYDIYNPEIPRAGMVILERMHELGLVNAIIEMPDTPSACFHVAANPDPEFINILR